MGSRDVPLCEGCGEPDFPWGACACERNETTEAHPAVEGPVLHAVAVPAPGHRMVSMDLIADHALMVMSVGADCDGVQAGVLLSPDEASELARQLLEAVLAVEAGPAAKPEAETVYGAERIHLTAIIEGDIIEVNGAPHRVLEIERGHPVRRFQLEPLITEPVDE